MALPLQLSPLLINVKTGEPYLRLPPPHSNIILTPPRLNDTDSEAIVQILNDRRVFRWIEGPPYPYYPEHARAWLTRTSKEAESLLKELEEKPGGFVRGCPVRILREVGEDGEEIFLGDCGISTWLFDDIKDRAERDKTIEQNEDRIPGDPDMAWGVGDYLAPSHHGRGIMTLALRTLIQQWMVPRMGAKKINANVWKGNLGSVRVFEKNGFVLDKTLENYRVVSESKGLGITLIGMHVMRWQG